MQVLGIQFRHSKPPKRPLKNIGGISEKKNTPKVLLPLVIRVGFLKMYIKTILQCECFPFCATDLAGSDGLLCFFLRAFRIAMAKSRMLKVVPISRDGGGEEGMMVLLWDTGCAFGSGKGMSFPSHIGWLS